MDLRYKFERDSFFRVPELIIILHSVPEKFIVTFHWLLASKLNVPYVTQRGRSVGSAR